MKTDLNSLKKEFNRLAGEIKKFDLATARPLINDLQKMIDTKLSKITALIRRETASAKKTSKKSSAKTAKPASKKTSSKSSATTTRKKAAKKVRKEK